MKRFLFLYPIYEYVDREITNTPDDLLIIERLNEIIDVRYRQLGYQINWLLFSIENNPNIIDLSIIDHRIGIYKTDRIIPAGLSRKRHREYNYPSSRRILAQIDYASELVIGGFHQTDCVEKIASTAYNNGTIVTVDEDTTDQFFKMAGLQQLPPVTRTREEYASSFRALLENMGDVFSQKMIDRIVQDHRVERMKKPWLAQI